ncbi:MAG: hypothetical protein A2896_01030 [Candidatus Nealsonbacteria bacterium RIFCSPLOWO2_01_FULL_43_32]|uniref:Uncharacterized protein n=1 Tax=Candidatus Nealsonbacteria bacterium RIFCSPLOWO2_01_FULL_43_32 TaxID=1801672 RepID=A0A1G2EG43_9BACT|nr:MAG: hypothetical protein A2896_01030 [Candidatus Nealsonbacteria bacterium RIFCSPLOWO2_01_FULL_43_32]
MHRKAGDRKPFCVEADVKGIGRIKKYTTASSERQAIFQVAEDLKQKYPGIRIFLDNRKVTLGEKSPIVSQI